MVVELYDVFTESGVQKKDTKTRILDAAEKIIVKRGADKASLRSITKEAGVNLAAINYHN